MPNPKFTRFVDPARARPQIWRLVLGLVIAIAVYALVAVGLFWVVWLKTDADPYYLWVDDILRADTPFSMVIVLATFIGMALGPMVAARVLHKRRAGTLFGPAVRTMQDFATATLIIGGLLGLSVFAWSFFYDAVPGVDLSTWIMLLPLAAFLVLIQTGAEELLFRGYLQQQLAARFRSPVIWAILPALLFGIAHLSPETAGENAWLVVGAAALFGLIAADLTAQTGSIGAAWGFHFANNFFALLIVSTEGTLTGLSLFRTPYSVDDPDILPMLLPVDLGMMILGWFIVRRAMSRR